MLAVNVAVMIGVLFYKLARPPYVPYIHLLVDYHFGFTKRALIGAIVSLFTAKVPRRTTRKITHGMFEIFNLPYTSHYLLEDSREPNGTVMTGGA